jgi:hypothetical protein
VSATAACRQIFICAPILQLHTGVADDAELDRLTDFDLMGTEIAAVGEGRPITIAWMKGRSRSYAISRGGKSALSLAFNERCDQLSQPSRSKATSLSLLNRTL